MSKCRAITKNGKRCTRAVLLDKTLVLYNDNLLSKTGRHYCQQHLKRASKTLPECNAYGDDGTKCTQPIISGQYYCCTHGKQKDESDEADSGSESFSQSESYSSEEEYILDDDVKDKDYSPYKPDRPKEVEKDNTGVCIAIKSDRKRCTQERTVDYFCTLHAKARGLQIPRYKTVNVKNDGVCIAIKSDKKRCTKKAVLERFCNIHALFHGITLPEKRTITITFGNAASNGKDTPVITVDNPVSPSCIADLSVMCDNFKKAGYKTISTRLSYGSYYAFVIVVKNYVKDDDQVMNELSLLDWDKKGLIYGKVKNKVARWSLIFANEAQEPNYEEGQGRVIPWSEVPFLNVVKERIECDFKGGVVAEGNYYYNNTCGINYHGDRERNVVIGLRLGDTIPLCFQWYYKENPVGDKTTVVLDSGDLYIMSEKTIGNDWLNENEYTLRHAAGADKYTTPKKK